MSNLSRKVNIMNMFKVIFITMFLFIMGCDSSNEDTLSEDTHLDNHTQESYPPGSPEHIAWKFFNVKNIQESKTLVAKKYRDMFSNAKKGNSKSFRTKEAKNAKHTLKIGKAIIEGKRAEVPYTRTLKGNGVDIKSEDYLVLVLEDNDWKVDLMGQSQRKAKHQDNSSPTYKNKAKLQNEQWMRDNQPQAVVHTEIGMLDLRMFDFFAKKKRLPNSLQELKKFSPDLYIIDPWGSPYIYQKKTPKHKHFMPGYRITSYGADRRQGGKGKNKDIVKDHN